MGVEVRGQLWEADSHPLTFLFLHGFWEIKLRLPGFFGKHLYLLSQLSRSLLFLKNFIYYYSLVYYNLISVSPPQVLPPSPDLGEMDIKQTQHNMLQEDQAQIKSRLDKAT